MNVLGLFAGVGGLELGVSLAVRGARTVCYVERDAFAAACLVARMEDKTLEAAPVWDDVSTFDGKPWRGVVDCIAGGFPCQDISVAGSGAGLDGARSGLWSEYARIVGEVGPELVFVENVPALTFRGIDRVLGDLAELGFDAEWDCFSAAGVGAPYLRRRVFILAHSSRARLEGTRNGLSASNCNRWDPEPDVGRVDIGTTYRMDRLRCLGNGVVPAVAARAWVTLYERIMTR